MNTTIVIGIIATLSTWLFVNNCEYLYNDKRTIYQRHIDKRVIFFFLFIIMILSLADFVFIIKEYYEEFSKTP
jgi:hypothetical protein